MSTGGEGEEPLKKVPNRTFNYSNQEVEKLFKGNKSINNYEKAPTIRPLLETDKFPEKILDSFYDLGN